MLIVVEQRGTCGVNLLSLRHSVIFDCVESSVNSSVQEQIYDCLNLLSVEDFGYS